MLRFHNEDQFFNVVQGNNRFPAFSRSKGKHSTGLVTLRLSVRDSVTAVKTFIVFSWSLV